MPERFTPKDLASAMERLSILKFWPADASTRAQIMALFAKIVPHKEALLWLTDQLVNHVNEWPGPAEVRGILDTRFRPADGIPGWSSLPGYTAAEGEARYQQALPPTDAPLSVEASQMIRRLAAGKAL